MRLIPPFVLGHLVAAIVLGVAAGAFVGRFGRLEAAVDGAAWMAAGVLSSALIAAWRPGLDAAAWKPWPVAVLANPILLVSLVFAWLGWHCDAAFAVGCLLAPGGGLLWRTFSRRSAPAT